MEIVNSIPPPLNQGPHQNGTGKGLRQQTDDRLKACNAYVAPCFLGQDPIPCNNTVGAALT